MSCNEALLSSEDVVYFGENKNLGMGFSTLIPTYYAAFFPLHGNVRNDMVVVQNTQSPQFSAFDELFRSSLHTASKLPARLRMNVSASHSLHTPAELQQPLHQVPPPRSGHIFLSCPFRRSLILHGGLEAVQDALLNDTWEYLIDEQRWIQLICRGVPSKNNGQNIDQQDDRRDSHSSGRERDEMVDDNDNGMPPKAFGQCGALFGNGRFLFVHGGVTCGNDTSFPAFQLDIAERLWTPLQLSQQLPFMWGSVAQTVYIPVSSSAFFSNAAKKCKQAFLSPSSGETAARTTQPETKLVQQHQTKEKEDFIEVVVVFGGMQGNRAFNDTYMLFLTTPPPTSHFLHYSDDEPRVVEKLPEMLSSIFPGRRRACSTVCKDYFIFVFGGRDSNYFYNDLWVLNACTRQWVMVREETPVQYMRDFFLRPFDFDPGNRIMNYVNNVLKMRKDSSLCVKPTYIPHRCMYFNSSARWRTGAVMVSRGGEIFIFGGFTYEPYGTLETHSDVHVYNFMRHVWREVQTTPDCALPPFPVDYFEGSSNSLSSVFCCQCSAGPEISPMPNPTTTTTSKLRQNCACSANWELVKNITSVFVEGRTMATMCADPVMPGFRFFLFGGRTEDEPNAELYDVRIHVDHAGLRVKEAEARQNICCGNDGLKHDVCFSPTNATDASPQLRRCFCWGEWTLREQVGEFIRAALAVAPRLCTTRNLLLSSDYRVVDEKDITEAQDVAVALKKKVDSALPLQLRSAVMWTPTFLSKK